MTDDRWQSFRVKPQTGKLIEIKGHTLEDGSLIIRQGYVRDYILGGEVADFVPVPWQPPQTVAVEAWRYASGSGVKSIYHALENPKGEIKCPEKA